MLCVVLAAPTMFHAMRPDNACSRAALAAAPDLTSTPLALLLPAASEERPLEARAAQGALPLYALYVTHPGAASPVPLLYEPGAAALAVLRRRLAEAGADAAAVLYCHDGADYTVLPGAAAPATRPRTPGSAAAAAEAAPELTVQTTQEYIKRVAPTVGLAVAKRLRGVTVRSDATAADLAAGVSQFLAESPESGTALLSSLAASVRAAEPAGILPAQRAACAALDPCATYEEVGAAFAAWLRSDDPRVPEGTRRLARELAAAERQAQEEEEQPLRRAIRGLWKMLFS